MFAVNIASIRSNFKPSFVKCALHIDAKLPGNDGYFYKHNPFDLKNAHCRKPLFPIHQLNLRIPGISGKQKAYRSRRKRLKNCRRGQHRVRNRRGRSPVWNGGRIPLFKRFPKWRAATRQWQAKSLDWCSLIKLRYFIKQGRLDTRFPITQRHMNDCKLVQVRRGVKLYNVNDLPFPYRIHIEVTAADQSSIDAINNVGGSVTIVYRHALNLKAHLHPGQFEILPRTARPDLNAIYALEKYRARGCIVHYIKPLWLLQEEALVKSELATAAVEKATTPSARTFIHGTDMTLEEWKEKLLESYRLRATRKGKIIRQQG